MKRSDIKAFSAVLLSFAYHWCLVPESIEKMCLLQSLNKRNYKILFAKQESRRDGLRIREPGKILREDEQATRDDLRISPHHLLNIEQNPEECDATGFNSSNAGGLIKSLSYIFILDKYLSETDAVEYRMRNGMVKFYGDFKIKLKNLLVEIPAGNSCNINCTKPADPEKLILGQLD